MYYVVVWLNCTVDLGANNNLVLANINFGMIISCCFQLYILY